MTSTETNERGFHSFIHALTDLFDIWSYIRRDDPEAADRVESELLDKCESLARNARARASAAGLYQSPCSVYSYLIAYRPGTDPLQILAIVHGGRGVKTVLREPGL